jgi:hypothetical protein
MAREEFLDELSDDFPSQRIYSYDENFRYETERRLLMDAVLEGTFEEYECNVKESDFGYKITADADFLLEVRYKEENWKKSFPYIAQAFDIAEAAYRFFVVVPRVLDEGEVLLSNEKKYPIDPESYEMHDHCLDDDRPKPVERIYPPYLRLRGDFLSATVFRCTDGTYMLNIIHRRAGKYSELLDKSFTDADFAEVIANKYLEVFDQEAIVPPDDMYECVYAKITH